MERLIEKVSHEPMSGCWLFTGGLDTDGYGMIGIGSMLDGSRTVTKTHRVAYAFLVGPIPEGMTLDHKCRVRCCVNPDHLEPVPQPVNVLRGESPSAKNARKTHCSHGHAFIEANTYITIRKGQRQRRCRTCLLAWQKARGGQS